MRGNFREILTALLALVLAVSLCACDGTAPEEPSPPESSPSSQPESSSNQWEQEPGPSSQIIEDEEPEEDEEDTADSEGDPEPEGRPEIGTGPYSLTDQIRHWSEDEIIRLMIEVAGQLYQEDEALTGLTPVFREGSESDVEYLYGIHIKGTPTGYFAYQNDDKEDVAFRAITCSVTWIESEKRYVLDVISFEEWELE